MDPASQAQAAHRPQLESLRHQALGPDQQSHVFLRNQAYTLFDHHWSKTKAVTATVGDVEQGLCEYIVALNLEGHVLATRPPRDDVDGVERHEQLHSPLVASVRATALARSCRGTHPAALSELDT